MVPRKNPALAVAVRRLVDLGHRRIVMLVREERLKPYPASYEQAFLNELAALGHFAALLRIKRREKALTVAELADRLGVSIPTARNLLRGNPAVAIGTYFEAATILGLALFEPDQDRFQTSRDRVEMIESLLPKRVVKPAEDFDDDF